MHDEIQLNLIKIPKQNRALTTHRKYSGEMDEGSCSLFLKRNQRGESRLIPKLGK